MELDPDTLEGRWIQKKGQDDFYFNIDDAYISAFCILGEDVAPAFEESQVQTFSLSEKIIKNDTFKEEFEEMKKDFRNFMFTLGEKDKIDSNDLNNDLEGGTDSMVYKFNIENPSSTFSSLNVEEEVNIIIINETEDTVVYFDLRDQNFYTRKFTLDEEQNLTWDDESEVIEYNLSADVKALEEKVDTLNTSIEEFELTIETKDEEIKKLESTIDVLQGSVDSYVALEKEEILKAKVKIINEFREKVSEEEIEKIENEIEKFSKEEIKAKLALIVYELSNVEDEDGNNLDPTKFTHKQREDSTGGAVPVWFKTVLDNNKKKNK